MGFAKLQISVVGTNRELSFRPGTSDETTIQQIFGRNDYNLTALGRYSELAAYYQRRREEGKYGLVVDAGANIGASAILFALTCPGSAVAAIEPDKGNFDLLTANTAGLPVSCLRAAVASRAGHAAVVDVGEGHWGYQTRIIADGTPTDQAVPCVTIDQIYRDYAAEHFPFIVKIDIEGAEADLFSANTAWVAITPLIIVELHDWLMPKMGTSRSFLQCIAQLDRDFIYIGENVFSIANDLTGR